MRAIAAVRFPILLLVLFLTVVALDSGAQLLPAITGAAAELDRHSVAAGGRQEVILSVHRFGRYAVTVASEQGVALQLVDRMAGPGEVHGAAGERDGRLDLFLDRGEYKIVTHGHPRAEGEARLEVHHFAELSSQPAPQLVELKPVDTRLEDFEQRSFWLQIKTRRWVQLEAAGRALEDLRLWRDGSWLLDAVPSTEVLDPVVGKPLKACRLAVQLEPGLYLLSAYGGEPQPWAEDSAEWPFHLRFGIPSLAMAGRARFEVGPFGYDRYLVPAKANFYRLELPEQRPAEIRVFMYSEQDPFARFGARGVIDKDSREPMAEIDYASTNEGFDQVVVRAEAGQPYILQHFDFQQYYRFGGSGDYWVSSVHAGHAEDSVDATGILAHWFPDGTLQKDPLREQTIRVDATSGWATRCNLLAPLTVFLDVRATGGYTIESSGVEARYRIEPFFVYRPRDYKAPPFKPSGSRWELDAGYYVLTADPVNKGILEIAIKPESLIEDLLSLIGQGTQVDEDGVRASVRFPSVPLQWDHSYVLYLNQQPGVRAGLVLRSLPVDLSQALPLTLRPGRQVEIPVKVSESSLLQVLSESGDLLNLSLDGGPWRQSETVHAGTRRMTVRNDGEATAICAVQATPTRLLKETPLPPLPQAALDALPDFSEITVAEPLYFDLQRSQRRTFMVRAEHDALYRLETTGLLDTEGNLRSRTITSLASSASGGSGRNFFLHQFLLSGDYQVTLAPRGRSAGHLGLQLTRTDPRDGGQLQPGLPVRLALDAGESVVYRFAITEAGEYRLRAMALGRSVRCRLEDHDGWPILTPNIDAEIQQDFEPGEYRLVLLPEPVAGRRLTLLERVEEELAFEGHGPHGLPLDRSVKHRWMEPEGGGPREPDEWRFELPGATSVQIRATNEMGGRLLRVSKEAREEVAELSAQGVFDGELEPGSYLLELRSQRNNNRVDYELQVRPEAMLAGMERHFTVPTTVPIAVGRQAVVEITSFGDVDVRARLRDGNGREVAAGDDRPGDWNFHLGSRLEAGDYSLEVQPVGRSQAATAVRVEERREVKHEAVDLPLDLDHRPGEEVHLLPISQLDGQLLLVSASSTDAVGLAVERRSRAGEWRTVVRRVSREVQVELPVVADDEYRLRLWSVDRRGDAVRLRAAVVSPAVIEERRLASVVRLDAVDGFEPKVAVVGVRSQRPGLLRHSALGRGVRCAPGIDEALEPAWGGYLPVIGGITWLAVDAGDGRVAFKAARVQLAADAPLQMPMDSKHTALVDVDHRNDGPLLLRALSMVGQPAVQVVASGDTGATRDLSAAAVRPDGMVAVSLAPRSAQARAWLAEEVHGSVDLRLAAFSFAAPSSSVAGLGRHEGELQAGEARAYDLPTGTKQVRLALTAGVVLVLANGEQAESVFWNGEQALVEELVSPATRMVLLALEAGRFAVDLQNESGRPVIVARTSSLERHMVRSGRLRVAVAAEAGAERWIFTAGSVRSAVLAGADGTVQHGREIAVGPGGGILQLEHEAGPVLAWIGEKQDPEAGLWQSVEPPFFSTVDLPAHAWLSGRARGFAIDNDQPALLEVEVNAPAVLRLAQPSGESSWVQAEGGIRHLLVAAGRSELMLRPVGRAELEGEIALRLESLTEVGEGLGPELLLAPGAGHAFRFSVHEAGPVGVGVRAQPDTVQVELVSAGGEALGAGVVQMHELEAGEYLLVVRTPADSEPVLMRAAVVGVQRPSTDPPEDVVREYLEMERSSP